MKLHAKTLAGLEDLVAQDMKQAGATEVSVGRRGVSCLADLKTMYHLCLHSRFVLRVLRHLTEFNAKNPDDLYRQCARFAWEDLIPVDGTFVVDATVHSEVFTHDHFAALRLKDAVVDRFRGKTGQRPSIDRVRPDVRLHLHIAGNKVTLSVDATGAPLSHRGYRPPQAKAPLNEVLAAGLLALSGWRPGTPLIDPMCGSGTFSTEAALWASGLPVQAGRRQFAFMKWSDFDASAWREVRDESMHEVKAVDTLIWASDNHPRRHPSDATQFGRGGRGWHGASESIGLFRPASPHRLGGDGDEPSLRRAPRPGGRCGHVRRDRGSIEVQLGGL